MVGNAAQVILTVSGGDLSGFNGVVGVALAAGQDIADTVGNVLTAAAPSGADESYTVDNAAPTVVAIERHDGVNAFGAPTNAGALAFRVTFSEAVANVDAADFDATGGTSGDATGVAPVAGDAARVVVTVSGGDLNDFNGAVGLTFAAGQDVTDAAGNALAVTAAKRRRRGLPDRDDTAPTVSGDRAPRRHERAGSVDQRRHAGVPRDLQRGCAGR